MKRTSGPADRNKGPILEVLRTCIPPEAFVLDLASGSGQHAVHFAQSVPGWTVQPTDIDPAALGSICTYIAEAKLPNLRHPARLDATDADWSPALPDSGLVDAVVCINMIHISPWESTLGLIAGAGRVVRPGGVLFLYGPYRVDGAPTTDSNARFEEWLKERDPRNGLRDIETVTQLAIDAGFTPEACVSMPADNFSVIFRKGV
jgi:SAM-dependent methyltransferase